MAPLELADVRVGLFPVQFPGLYTLGRIHKHRAVLDGGYKGGRIGDFWRISHHLSDGNGGYARKPCNQGAAKVKVKQSRLQRVENTAADRRGSRQRTYFGLWSQEMGGLKPGADTALKKTDSPMKGTVLGRADVLHAVARTGMAAEKHTWQVGQVLQ